MRNEAHTKVTTADLLIRYSDLRDTDLSADGVAGNISEAERVLREYAGRLGWTVGKVIVENDMTGGRLKPASAYKRKRVMMADGTTVLRTWRPGFRELLDRLQRRVSNAVLAIDLDRIARDPRDLEDLIDVMEATRANARSVSGSLTFSDGGTDGEITMARVMVTMGNKSSRDTARRVAAARLRQAMNGEYAGGTRPYGYEADGMTVIEAEKAVVEQAARNVLARVPLREQCRDLNARGVPTPNGATEWHPSTLRAILLRPRNAAFMVYRAEIIDRAPWAPLLETNVWGAVAAKLSDPARKTPSGGAPRYLGTALYACHCGATVQVECRKDAPRRYRCGGGGHVKRDLARVDAVVTAAVLEWLRRPEAADLLDAPEDADVDVPALRAKVQALRTLKADAAAMFGAGEIDRAEYAAMRARNETALTEALETLESVTRVSPLATLVGADNLAEVWESMPLGSRRAVIREVCTVTIRPTGRRGSGFDPESVEIRWNV